MHRREFLSMASAFAGGSGLMGGMVFAGPFSFGKAATAKIDWHTDLRAAHKIAVKDDKPLLIVFGASWCTYCHKLEKETLHDKRMVQFVEKHFVPVHLDFDKEPAIAKTLEVEQLPATVVLSPQADLLARTIGYLKYDEYRDQLDLALQERQKILQVRATQK